ncbi:SEL1-like repeat protein [Actinomadura formosensis]|uniref:sel1 repeat family protein n=1 Tax=Actinomadura formosensis TaxID=60706 RepID=UPI00083569C5|nr:sel1 repeat family protein [Actinomadura formosensis]
MTIDPPLAHTEVNAFIHDLRRFINACCLPSDRELVRLASKVIATRKGEIPALREVTQAVLSRVMTGKRQGPPAWGWVATVVLTCLEFHAGSGAELDYDGPVSLQQWYTRYQQMRDQLARVPASPPTAGPAPTGVGNGQDRGAGGHDASMPGTGATGEQEPVPLDGPVSMAPPPPPGPPDPVVPVPSAQVPRVEDMDDSGLDSWLLPVMSRLQSRAHRRHYALFGQYGADLLTAAENGDREAASRLGILLLCHGLPGEGLAWLRSAADRGDEPAKILVNAAKSRQRQMAAELAYEFALPGYDQDRADGALTGAEVYYRAAAAVGHIGATIRMGLIFEARGETATALHTYAQAAAQAHPDALDHFERLNHQLAQQATTRPAATRDL